MTPGMRTSEFWLAVLVVSIGAGMVVAGAILGRDSLIAAGTLQQSAVALAYTLGRSKTKAPRPYLPPRGTM